MFSPIIQMPANLTMTLITQFTHCRRMGSWGICDVAPTSSCGLVQETQATGDPGDHSQAKPLAIDVGSAALRLTYNSPGYHRQWLKPRIRPARWRRVSEWTKAVPPQPHRLVADVAATFKQEVLDVAQ